MKFVIYGLACWRLSRMLTSEAGPYEMFVKLRVLTGIEHDAEGKAVSWREDGPWPLHCLCCTSVWVAAALLVAPSWVSRWLAISMIAVAGDSTEQLFNYLNKD